MTFGGVEALLVPWMTTTLGVRTVTETPAKLLEAAPIHKVNRVGGGTFPKVPSIIYPRVVVTTFDVGYAAALQSAEDAVRAITKLLPNSTIAGSTVTGATVNSGPTWVPYADTALRQFSTLLDLVIQTA